MCLFKKRFSDRKNEIKVDDATLFSRLASPPTADQVLQLSQAISALVDSSEQVNYSRHKVNTLFLTINTLLLGEIGWVGSVSAPMGSMSPWFALLIVCATALLGAVLNTIWEKILESYWATGASTIEIIKAIESKLYVRVFTQQYSIMENVKYKPLTDREQCVTHVFQVVHGLLALACMVMALLLQTGAIQMPTPKI